MIGGTVWCWARWCPLCQSSLVCEFNTQVLDTRNRVAIVLTLFFGVSAVPSSFTFLLENLSKENLFLDSLFFVEFAEWGKAWKSSVFKGENSIVWGLNQSKTKNGKFPLELSSTFGTVGKEPSPKFTHFMRVSTDKNEENEKFYPLKISIQILIRDI